MLPLTWLPPPSPRKRGEGRLPLSTAPAAPASGSSGRQPLRQRADGGALRLASLHGHGPRRLGATRAQLIDSDADQYDALSAWGQALHDCPAEPDGIVWRSRHYDDAYALVLFADRVGRRELEVVEPPLPLGLGRGLDRVMELAEQAAITLVE